MFRWVEAVKSPLDTRVMRCDYGRFIAEYEYDGGRAGRYFAVFEPLGSEMAVAMEGRWYLSVDRLQRMLECVLQVLGPRRTAEIPAIQ